MTVDSPRVILYVLRCWYSSTSSLFTNQKSSTFINSRASRL